MAEFKKHQDPHNKNKQPEGKKDTKRDAELNSATSGQKDKKDKSSETNSYNNISKKDNKKIGNF